MPVPLSMLLIEDSADDAALIIRQLEKAEYSVVAQRVETAGELKEALIAKRFRSPDASSATPRAEQAARFSTLELEELKSQNSV